MHCVSLVRTASPCHPTPFAPKIPVVVHGHVPCTQSPIIRDTEQHNQLCPGAYLHNAHADRLHNLLLDREQAVRLHKAHCDGEAVGGIVILQTPGSQEKLPVGPTIIYLNGLPSPNEAPVTRSDLASSSVMNSIYTE